MMYMLCAVLLAACHTVNPPEPERPVSDDSTDIFVTTTERGGYSTFFKPQIAWVGDVMPFYDEASGVFHIFYLQDWRPAAGIIHPIWDVETKDFATYTNNREAIPLGKSYEQDVAIGTGGAIRGADSLYHFYYTGEMADNPDARQAIMHATSTDLSVWKKDRMFGYMRATDGYNPHEFRDACVFRDEEAGVYRMAVTTHWWGANAIAHYTSADMTHWTPAPQPLVKDAPHFMECSDFFKMGKWWYITYSSINAPRCVYYRYKEGSLDSPDGWSDPIPLDGHSFYAAKNAADNKGNRYLCGWGQTFAGIYDSSDWGGALVVHRLAPRNGGPLLDCCPPDGTRNKFNRQCAVVEQKRQEVSYEKETYTLDAKNGRSFVQFNRLRSPLCITCDIQQLSTNAIFGFTFAASSDKNNAQHLRFIIEPDNNNKADLAQDSDADGQINLRSVADIAAQRNYRITLLIEHSLAVMYINNQIAFTARIYGMENNPWQIFCESGRIQLSNLKLNTL